MIKSSLKGAVAIVVLAGASASASADTVTDLGTISTSTPTTFTGSVLEAQTSFSDIFTFTLAEPNISSGYNVVNFPLDLGEAGTLATVLATMSLVSYGVDNMQGTADDQVLQSVVLPSAGNTQDNLSLAWDGPLTGGHYLNITGVTSGSLGGIYAGSIAAAVPEPETYAMLLAGLGLMGAVVRRRSMRKPS
ncbi:FxDxF family PEP-CTERM protein [Nitrosovibrio sp. Nv4]|uniref:FxDxF family PEP-CTERM protein n=1 Tax=Nitrosovibrio sp. Nv4 TaxID=1945880 RepID=UPI000BCF855E|nr:FxDxF family PEP-CTERM protein [Nitrosovibrio sp. Nv4]SOD40075.1 PEP-CTERM protein-sorting domain-containing protein [Nitrosovibrio sp. Nv4]